MTILRRFPSLFLPGLALLCMSGSALADAPKPTYAKPGDLRKAGWKIDRPPYPVAARAPHEQGTIYLEMTTDTTGKIIRVRTPGVSKHPVLDAFMVQ